MPKNQPQPQNQTNKQDLEEVGEEYQKPPDQKLEIEMVKCFEGPEEGTGIVKDHGRWAYNFNGKLYHDSRLDELMKKHEKEFTVFDPEGLTLESRKVIEEIFAEKEKQEEKICYSKFLIDDPLRVLKPTERSGEVVKDNGRYAFKIDGKIYHDFQLHMFCLEQEKKFKESAGKDKEFNIKEFTLFLGKNLEKSSNPTRGVLTKK